MATPSLPLGCSLLLASPAAADLTIPGNIPSPEAVREVAEGRRSTANAAWWGFDAEDATQALQAAIDSGARRVVVPNMGSDWIVGPIRLAGHQELFLERGAVVSARRGAFRGGGDCLFQATAVDDVTIRGYGATVRMHKQDYMDYTKREVYPKAEWRMTLSLRGVHKALVEGLTIRDSGGDGIYIDGGGGRDHSRDITIRDVVCDNHYRQGISVISVVGLTVEDSEFANTWGTPPSAGVDIEPDRPDQKAQEIVFRNCLFRDNYGAGIQVYLRFNEPDAQDVSILFDRCRVTSRLGSGLVFGALKAEGPGGLIEFRDCVVEDVAGVGAHVYDKHPERARVRFTRTRWIDVGTGLDNAFARVDSVESRAPLLIYNRRPELITPIHGGIDFVDCEIVDGRDRPFLSALQKEPAEGLFDVTGSIRVRNPHGARMDLQDARHGVSLEAVPVE